MNRLLRSNSSPAAPPPCAASSEDAPEVMDAGQPGEQHSSLHSMMGIQSNENRTNHY
jgi:hypothetical protein